MLRGVLFGLIVAGLAVPAVRAESLLAVDWVFVETPTFKVFGDHFDQGALSSLWSLPTGQSPAVSGTTAQFSRLDHIVSTPDIPHGVDLTIGALMHENLPSGTGQYGFLVVYGANTNDFIAVGVAPNGVFVTDESLALLGLNGFGGGDIGIEVKVSAAHQVTVTANDTVIYNDHPDFGPVSSVGFLVIPEPAALMLLAVGTAATFLRRRRS